MTILHVCLDRRCIETMINVTWDAMLGFSLCSSLVLIHAECLTAGLEIVNSTLID